MWTPDPISLEVIKKLTGLVLDVVWKKSGEKITEQIQRQVGTAVEEYVRTYEKRHCTLKYDCLRMDNPTNLEEIYTDVQVLDTRESRRFESPEALKELFLEIGRGFAFEKTTRQNGVAVANLQPRLMVLGSPGIGKSTFLRKVGLEALKWETSAYRHELIPVFLELKRFDASQTQIEKFIAQEFETCGFPNAEEFTKRLLKAGKLLILLDGLDEVPTDQVDRAIEQIGDLVDRYDQNRFIASCRIAAYKGGFPRFKDVTMASFDDSQMQTFVQRWFRREPKVGEECWTLLNSSDYKAAKELGQTPLLLTLLCAVYDESQDFPKRRAALYGEALDVWLKKWASEKRIAHDPIYRELSLELEKILLSEIAYESFSEDQLFFSKWELKNQIRQFLVGNLNAPKHLDAEAVLQAIEKQQGILVERAIDAYSFSHLTFQEYLTAQYIVDEQKIGTLVKQHLTNKTWRETFLLTAGLMRRADELLEQMEHEAQKLITTDKLKALLNWATQTTADSEGDYKPATKRAVALNSIPKHACNIQLAKMLGFDLDLSPPVRIVTTKEELLAQLERNRARNEACNPFCIISADYSFTKADILARAKVFTCVNIPALIAQLRLLNSELPSRNASDKECQAFDYKLEQTWCNAFLLDRDWLDLSEEEQRSLENYLYANELMIRCKEAAVRVSPQVWETIESRMLTVRDN